MQRSCLDITNALMTVNYFRQKKQYLMSVLLFQNSIMTLKQFFTWVATGITWGVWKNNATWIPSPEGSFNWLVV
jgi:hypothetical protein